MRKDLITFNKIQSSLFSYDKDIELILRALFVSSRPYSDKLKKLLIINNPDCLDDNNQDYKKIIDSFQIKDMRDAGYIRLNRKIARGTHEEVKTYLLISLDNYSSNRQSAHFRDYTINFDIICYNDTWEMNDYKIRPLEIAGYIDGILNSITRGTIPDQSFKSQMKLTGIGEYQFLGLNENVLNEDLSMYTLSYRGVHFSEDKKENNNV